MYKALAAAVARKCEMAYFGTGRTDPSGMYTPVCGLPIANALLYRLFFAVWQCHYTTTYGDDIDACMWLFCVCHRSVSPTGTVRGLTSMVACRSRSSACVASLTCFDPALDAALDKSGIASKRGCRACSSTCKTLIFALTF